MIGIFGGEGANKGRGAAALLGQVLIAISFYRGKIAIS